MSWNPIAGSRQIMQKSNKSIFPVGRLMPKKIMLFSRLFSKYSSLEEFMSAPEKWTGPISLVILNHAHEMIVKTSSGRLKKLM